MSPNGTLAGCGTYEELISLGICLASKEVQEVASSADETPASPSVGENALDTITAGKKSENYRNSGDFQTYVYYMKSFGLLSIVAFMASEISFAFFSVFPSLCYLNIPDPPCEY